MDMDTLRADFVTVTEDRKVRQGWSAEDVAELGAYVRAAVDQRDDDRISDWETYLSHEALLLHPSAQACRDAEASIRAQRKEERERAEGLEA